TIAVADCHIRSLQRLCITPTVPLQSYWSRKYHNFCPIYLRYGSAILGDKLAGDLFHRGIVQGARVLPADGPARVEYQQIGIVWTVEPRRLLELLLAAVDQHEMIVLIFGRAALDTVSSHAAHQAGHVFEHRDRPRRKTIAHAN